MSARWGDCPLFQLLDPVSVLDPIIKLAEVLLQKYPEHVPHVRGQGQLREVGQGFLPHLTFFRRMKNAGEAVRPVKKHHIAGMIGIPILDAHQTG